jgi:hypothetical protein
MSATSAETGALESLADTLWTERHVVGYLLFKLVTAKLVLASDERRFVAPALDEVERMMEALREAELRREMALGAVAEQWELSTDDLTLSYLVERAPEPLRSVFADHRDAFLGLAQEIDETAAHNRRLASAALDHVQQSLEGLTGPAQGQTYTSAGRPDTPLTAPTRLDRVL